MRINEISRASELQSAKGKKISKDSVVYDIVDLQKIYKFNEGSFIVYTTADNDYITALVITTQDNELIRMENISGKKGLVTIIMLSILHNEGTLLIKPTEELTYEGIKWVIKQIHINRYFNITDYNHLPINPKELDEDWFNYGENIGVILTPKSSLNEDMINNQKNYAFSLDDNSVIRPMIKWVGDKDLL